MLALTQQITAMGAVAADAPTRSAMAASLALQIWQANLSLADATALAQTIGADPHMSAEDKSRCAQAALQRAMSLAGGARPAGNGLQSLENPMEYLTASDWVKLDAEKLTRASAVQVAVARFQMLGLIAPSEQTVKNISALLATVLYPDSLPSPAEAHTLVQDIKTSVRAHAVSIIYPRGPAVYPATPAELPSLEYSRAYSHADPPVSRVAGRYYVLKQTIVLRTPVVR